MIKDVPIMVGVCVWLWHNMDIVCREPSHYIIVPRPKNLDGPTMMQ